MSDNLFNEVKLKVVQLAEQQGIPVQELLFQIHQEVVMDRLDALVDEKRKAAVG